MRVLVEEPFHDGFEAISGAVSDRVDPVAQVHDETPVLLRVLGICDSF